MTLKNFKFHRFMLNTLNWKDPHNISAFRKTPQFQLFWPQAFLLKQHPMLWPPSGLHFPTKLPPAWCSGLKFCSRGEGDLRRVVVCLSRFSTAGANCHKPEPRLKTEKQTERISRGTQGFTNAVTRTWLYSSCQCQHNPHGIFSVHTHSNSA